MRYLWCNEYYLNMTGFKNVKEIQGKTDYDLPWREKADQLTDTDKQVLRSKEAIFLTKKVPWMSEKNGKAISGIIGISVSTQINTHFNC